MATTIQNATLTVVVTETLSLGGTQYGGTKTLEIADINEVFKRIVKCAASQTTTIATFNGNAFASDNAIDLENVRYIRVTNLDDTNPMNLSLQVAGGEGGTANMSATHLVGAGQSFIMHTVHDGIAVNDTDASLVDSLTDLESLLVDPLSEDIDVEVLIASV